MLSVDFAEIEILQHKEEWGKLDEMMSDAALQLEKAGADIIILCTNTMHLCYEAIIEKLKIPFLHIAEAVGQEISSKKINKVGLLGTKFTMEKDFYKNYLNDNFNIEVIIPPEEERKHIHDIIYGELVHGNILDGSRKVYQDIISGLEARGAKGVILGCTEIPLLIKSNDINIPAFDTTTIHAVKAVFAALDISE